MGIYGRSITKHQARDLLIIVDLGWVCVLCETGKLNWPDGYEMVSVDCEPYLPVGDCCIGIVYKYLDMYPGEYDGV